VLHAYGRRNEITVPESPHGSPPYVAVPYLDRMDLAYAAADLVMARSGAMTVAEIAAVGLPAVYVPLPHGNGEQRLNASGQVASGAAIIVDDADLDREAVASKVIPLVIDGIMRDGMTASAAQSATQRADDVIARMVLDAAAGATHGRPG
jgi:UDP-N-acetylglucosamine--N-acetylmuramyl-(pentapeptide) pyrophosphoryl-undecaprenol N-acetylglucosamine transferase